MFVILIRVGYHKENGDRKKTCYRIILASVSTSAPGNARKKFISVIKMTNVRGTGGNRGILSLMHKIENLQNLRTEETNSRNNNGPRVRCTTKNSPA